MHLGHALYCRDRQDAQSGQAIKALLRPDFLRAHPPKIYGWTSWVDAQTLLEAMRAGQGVLRDDI